MIGKLQGIIDYIGEGFVIVMTGGVGYRVFVPTSVLVGLKMDDKVSLWIETNVREDHIHLFGFESKGQQDLFNQLTSVSGVGPKVGLGIIGAFRPEVLMNIIASEDVKTMTAAPGVGKKVAERIIVELKGKVNAGAACAGGTGTAPMQDLLSALEALGYRRADTVELAQRLVKETPDADVGTLVRLALKEMTR
ncbi:MAG: Holliday junction branch migration protein RuvA [Alphaproteobacteria bacterium]|nr:Holliday junction branch migration protein RuvA [Alphaproteobacteria bacterium]